MKHRILVLVTAFVLALNMISVSAAQADNDSANSRSVKLLNALGIMGIDSNTDKFWDDTPVERLEVAKILCNMFQIEATDDDSPRFIDVKKGDRKYIETVVRMGYMSGYGDGEFGSRDYVTREQLIKIFVTVLDADKMADVLGGFPTGYIAVARKIKLLNGTLNGDLTAFAKRIDVADMIYSALHIDMPTLIGVKNDNSVYEFTDGATFLTEMLNIYSDEGIVNMNEATALDDANGAGKERIKVDDEIYFDPKGILDDYLGYSVNVYVKKPNGAALGEIIYAEEMSGNDVITVTDDDDISVSGFKVSCYQNDKKRELNLNSYLNMIYNGKAVDYDSKYLSPKNGYVKFIDNNGDKLYDVVCVTEYKSYVADKVRAEDEIIKLKYNEPSLKLKDNFYRIYKNGERATIKDIGIGDVLLVAASKQQQSNMAYRIDVSPKYAMGTIDRVWTDAGDDYISVGGADYRVGDYCKELIKNNHLIELTPGHSGRFFIDGDDNIVYFSVNSLNSGVGYLIDAAIINDAFSDSVTMRIYTIDGKIEEFKTNDKISVNGSNKDVSKAVADTNFKDKLSNPCLIEYTAKDGIIKKINFAEDAYDAQSFSKDASGSFKCTGTSVLGFKYNVTANTQVFRVPTLTKNESSYYQEMHNAANYRATTGTYFSPGTWYNDTEIYDVGSSGEVKYAVVKYSPNLPEIYEYDSLIAVTGVGDGIDEEGSMIRVIWGLDESGNEITLETTADETNNIIDTTLKREVKTGDIIQYRNYATGKISEIKIQHDIDNPDYYAPMAIEPSKANFAVFKSYGEVMSDGGASILLSCKPIWDNMTPVDADAFISNSGKALYRFNRDNKKFTKTEFGEIERSDKVFVCINSSNYARMIVVYD